VRATKRLPDRYVRYEAFKPATLKKVSLLLNAATVVLFVVAYPLFIALASALRPGFVARVASRLSFDPVRMLEMVAAILAFFAVHEMIHGAILWFFTRERPILRVSLRGACVEVATSYLPRNALLVTSLTPVCLLSLAGVGFLLLVPPELLSLLVLLLAANAGGSAADLAGSFFVSLFPASAYLSTRGDIYLDRPVLATPEQEAKLAWKVRLRSFLERAVAKLD